MRIDRLLLTAFGRFQGEALELAPGLNVIYGPNEAGKTTLQKFILGMFYGFKKRSQRRAYTEDAERYRPWQGGEYRGVLEYTLDDGRPFRIEREFEPGRDWVRLYDRITGEDLSGQFPLDRRKELLFAEAQLQLPEELFRATAWVGQMELAHLEAGEELMTRVANIQESGREDLSVQAALEWLDARAREIGTERAATRPYARVLKALAERRQELERAERVREQTRDWEARLIEVRGALSAMEEEREELYRHLRFAELAELEERQARVADAEARLREVRERMALLSGDRPESGLTESDRERLDSLREQESRLAVTVADLEQELASLRGRKDAALPRQMRTDAGRSLAPVVLAALGAAALVAALLLSIKGSLMVPVTAGLGVLLLLLAGWTRSRHAAQAAEDRERLLRYEQVSARLEAQAARLSQVREEIARLPREALQRAQAEAETLEGALRTLLGGITAQGLAEEIAERRAQLGLGGASPGVTRSAAALQEQIRRLEARQASLQSQESDLAARVETVLADLPDTAELLREIGALEEEKAGYEAELAALDLARETLESVAAEMHRDFAPRLNQALSEAVRRLTGGRYAAARVDQELAIRAVAPGERTVDLPSLSGGTVDQFYLALRIALLDLLTDGAERIPLLLDDPLVQFDDGRAEAAMRLLAEIAADRQVVLMTCHRREADLARAVGARLVNLGEVRV